MVHEPLKSAVPASQPAPETILVESAREVMRALVKAVKASKMYLSEHEICRKFRDDFATRLFRHLDEHGDLALTVKGYEFCVGATPVYEEPNRIENLAFRCSADGLRELVVQHGMTSVDALKAGMREKSDEFKKAGEIYVKQASGR